MNGFLERVLECLWRCSWQASLLVGLVLLAQWVFRGRLAARWRHALWWLVLARLVMPVAPESPLSIFNAARVQRVGGGESFFELFNEPDDRRQGIEGHPRQPTAGLSPAGSGPAPETSSKPDGAAAKPSPSSIVVPAASAPVLTTKQMMVWGVALIWGLGVIYLGARVALGNYCFARRLDRRQAVANPAAQALLEQCLKLMGVRAPLVFVETAAIDSPALFGCFRLKLLLPEKMTATFSPAELRYVFLHELGHIRRGDPCVNWLMTLLQCLHWFNPVLWLAFARMRADRELACDELALAHLREDENQSYGQTIIKLLAEAIHPAATPGLVGIIENKVQMKRRINMIATFKRTAPGSALAAALLAGLGLLTLTDAQSQLGDGKSLAKPEEEAGTTVENRKISALGAAKPTEVSKPIAGSVTNGIVDAKTGLRFKVVKTFSGENDVIEHLNKLVLSPNGKFLHWWGRVVPLDGNLPFPLTDLRADHECYSPDGTKIAFLSGGSICVSTISPEAGRLLGPPKRLLAQANAIRLSPSDGLEWTRDSKVLCITMFSYSPRARWAVDVANGIPIHYPELTQRGMLSPDGTSVLHVASGGIWVTPVQGGASRNLSPRGTYVYGPAGWSGDGQWILGGASVSGQRENEALFIRRADGCTFSIANYGQAGAYIGNSPNGKELWFYQPSYELRDVTKVASLASGPPVTYQDINYLPSTPWSPDGKSLLAQRWSGKPPADWKWELWSFPLSGGEPVQLKIEANLPGSPFYFMLSPDGKKLLLAARRGRAAGGPLFDLYVAPIALEAGRTTGPAVLVFKNCTYEPGSFDVNMPWAWSPDSRRLAVVTKGEKNFALYVISAAGGEPRQLTDTPDFTDQPPKWSADGRWVAYRVRSGGLVELRVISSGGGAPRTVRAWPPDKAPGWCWSPDSQAITVADTKSVVDLPIQGGQGRQVASLGSLAIGEVWWLQWSPDGQTLALQCAPVNNTNLRVWGRLLLARRSGAQLEKVGEADLTGGNWIFAWSPDSTRLAYSCEDAVRTRPAGVLCALKVENVLQKIEAGSILPLAIPRLESVLAKSEANPPPVAGSQFVENFNDGDTEHWQFHERANEGPPFEHSVSHGELILENSSADFGQTNWVNYVIKVRFCIEKAELSRSLMGLGFRRGPQGTYYLVPQPLDQDLWLGMGYHVGTNIFRTHGLAMSDCDFKLNRWHALQCEVRGHQVKAFVDGVLKLEATDTTWTRGGVGLLAGNSRVRFGDFSVQLLP